ncbi:hypothetical protein ACFHWD_03535 [Clostridium sp. MT-14]|uniref:hypothetical protein n=1 Tax=Clostridium sp. MT-14 TaxID=3348360 RepID=UPI0035F3DA24
MDNRLSSNIEIKNTIRIHYFNKYYYKCINLCNKFLYIIKKQRRKFLIDIRDELFFVNFYLGISYKNLSDWKLSKYYIKKSIKYSLNDTFLNLSIKQLADFYVHIRMFNKAINSYKLNLCFYKNINDVKNRADILFNVAMIRDRPNHMQQIIYIMERNNYLDGNKYHNLIVQKYIELIEYLFEHNQGYKGKKVLNNIGDINIKSQVCQGLYQKIA